MPFSLCVRYFVLLALLLAVSVAIGRGIHTYELLGDVSRVYAEHFPTIHIREGKMIVEGNQPIVYDHPEFQIKVDTSGSTTRLDPLVKQGAIFDSDHMTMFLEGAPEPRQFAYSQLVFADMTFTPETIQADRPFVSIIFGVGFFMFSIASWALIKWIHIFIASAVVELFANLFRVTVIRDVRYTLAMTALVPPFVLEAFQIASNMVLPFNTPIYVTLYGFFLVMGTIQLLDIRLQKQS